MIQARGDNVILKQLKSDKETKSGILLPEKTIHHATIVSLGGDCPTDQVCVGDRVVFGLYTGANIKVHGEDFLVVKYEDLLGRVDEISK